ncbi:hypothetical protein EAMG_00249 [Escherichia coli M056]|uniref:Uncharacterized protein n=1 Tax=Escherichia coli TA447 TaxID=656447 RepID=A0A1X3J4N9_ECOLX|nr:hypothetical protein ECSP_0910 [Escherichia coli O157:H7 str. TW14359]EGI22158.1 conserved hypothetical protein [Escherichia coli M718]EGI32556.1 conserved hypothetical protein [Escherichia coli TA143]OSK16967.1 hypothetical protein EANG_02674 [Escherichia coli FVEC1465]OSK28669.1 hypothetical protein EAMG_00249 [Escherichia coli M056]OSK88569.1 hypothetical protein ECYG_01216 [Escherichia coli B367]OSK95995.1 hypothetical protein ECXG_04437 [Escherichia coli TA447]OSL24534.1 hypothetical
MQNFSLLFLYTVFIYRIMQKHIYSENSWRANK